MGNKNKKKPQTGGLQPKGGAYAKSNAVVNEQGVIIQNDVDPMVANAALKDKAKEKRDKEKAKLKEKQKRENPKKGQWRIGFVVGGVLGAIVGVVLAMLINQDRIFFGGMLGFGIGAILLAIIVGNLTKFKETGAELKKVRWPTLNTTIKKTGVVLGVVVMFSLVVFALDMGLGYLYDLLTSGY